jgi:hypothetical protein
MAEVDLNRVVRQHAEMDGFFTGFAIRAKAAAPDDSAPAAVASSVNASHQSQPGI